MKPLLERYFGRIPRGHGEPPPVVTLEPKQLGEKRFNAAAETSPTVRDLVADGAARCTRTRRRSTCSPTCSPAAPGRLYKGLVLGRQVANDVVRLDRPAQVRGHLHGRVHGQGRQGAGGRRSGGLRGDREAARTSRCRPRSCRRSRTPTRRTPTAGSPSPFAVFMQLVRYDALGDWQLINTSPELADAVTAADLQRVAQEYLTKENRTVGDLPAQGGRRRPPTPSSRACRRRRRPWCGRPSQQIAAEKDPAKLEQMVEQMQQMGGQVPAEMKPAFELILKRATERLAGALGREEVRTAMKRTATALLLAARRCSPPPARPPARAQAHPRPAREAHLPADRVPAAAREGPPRGAEERHGRLHRRGPGPAARERRDHRAHGQLARARRQGGPRRVHRLADAPRRHEDASPPSSSTRSSTSSPPRSAPASAPPPARPRSTASPTTSTRRSRLFVEVLRRPRFQEDRLALAKEQALQEMKKRNDDSERHRGARVGRPPLRRRPSSRTASRPRPRCRSITREDMLAFHRRYFYPANMIAAVSGSFAKARRCCASSRRPSRAGPRPEAPTPPIPDAIAPRRPGPLPRAEGRQPGPRLDRAADGEARPPRRLRARGDERDPRRQRLHLAHHEDRPLERGPRLLGRLRPRARRLVPGPLPRRRSSRRAARCPGRPSWCWRRSAGSARRP